MPVRAASDLRQDLARDELEVVEVVEVEELEVGTGRAGLGVLPELVDDLRRGAADAGALHGLTGLADGLEPS